jgi:hypothetical protein
MIVVPAVSLLDKRGHDACCFLLVHIQLMARASALRTVQSALLQRQRYQNQHLLNDLFL